MSWTSQIFTTGYTTAHARLARRDGPWQPLRFHATCVLLHHPVHGYLLFDTGYHPRFLAATRRWPDRLYALATPVVCAAGWSVAAQLAARGIAPAQIRHVFLSHFHADHIAGLLDFPAATVWCSRAAWAEVRAYRGLAAVRRGLVHGLLPADLGARLRFVDECPRTVRTDALRTHYDLQGDGSLLAVPLPGHARGQTGLLFRDAAHGTTLLAADAFWLTGALRAGVLPSRVIRLFIDDWSAFQQSYAAVAGWWTAHPGARVLSCHCPSVYTSLTQRPYHV